MHLRKWFFIGLPRRYISRRLNLPRLLLIRDESKTRCGFNRSCHSLEDYSWIQTETGNPGARLFGFEKAALTVEQSVEGLIKVFDAATRETHGGKLWVWDGRQVP